MRSLCLAPLLLATSAYAFEPACESYVAAAEKSAAQPARHSVSELNGDRLEAIVIGGRSYTAIGGKWREMKMDMLAMERKLNAELRAGKYSLSGCKKLGSEKVGDVETTVIAYTLVIPGLPEVGESKVFIGKDGLVYAQSNGQTKIRYWYAGVTAPKL